MVQDENNSVTFLDIGDIGYQFLDHYPLVNVYIAMENHCF